MKKKLVALLISTAMVATMMMGCGAAEAPATTEAPAAEAPASTEEAPAAEADAEGCSDEVFAALQEDYVILVQYRDAANEIYLDDSVEQSDDIEALLTEADEIIAQMGEISQDQISDADALELENSMNELIGAFENIVGAMEPAEDADEATGEEVYDADEVLAELVNCTWTDEDGAFYTFYDDGSVACEGPDGSAYALEYALQDGKLYIGSDETGVVLEAAVTGVDTENGVIVFEDGTQLAFVSEAE